MPTNFDNIKLFGDKSLSDLFKQIHKNNKDIDKQINDIIQVIKPLATSNAGSAVMLLPTVKDLIDVNVRNNDQLIKMAGIAQRASITNESNDTDFINYEEIQQLLSDQNKINENTKLLEDKIKDIK